MYQINQWINQTVSQLFDKLIDQPYNINQYIDTISNNVSVHIITI